MNSYLAIFIAGIIPMLVGFVWYHEKLFGKRWRESLGLSQDDLRQGNMAMIFGGAFLTAIFLAWKLNEWSSHVEPGMSQFVHGFFHGAVGIGLPAAAVLVSNSLFQRNSLANILINAAYWIITLGLMGAFLYSVATPEAASGG